MEFVVVLVLITLVVLVVSAPLRRGRGGEPAGLSEVAELEAAREAKLREIRDAELDHRTGKLSDADFARLESELRAEAVGILRRLDDAGASASASPPG